MQLQAGVLAGGATASSGTDVRVQATLAQPIIGVQTSPTVTANAGFWPAVQTVVIVQPPAQPTLTAPADGATDVDRAPTLTWQPVATARTYEVQVATDEAFTTLVLDSIGLPEPSLTVPALAASTTFFWRVRAVNDAGPGPYAPPFRFTTATDTGVGVEDEAVPTTFALHANYPNPFNPTTTIPFALPHPSRVTVAVFDMLGRRVATLVDRPMAPGTHAVSFEAADLPSGLYLYRLDADGFQETRSMLLLK